jgi:hypothetical protein
VALLLHYTTPIHNPTPTHAFYFATSIKDPFHAVLAQLLSSIPKHDHNQLPTILDALRFTWNFYVDQQAQTAELGPDIPTLTSTAIFPEQDVPMASGLSYEWCEHIRRHASSRNPNVQLLPNAPVYVIQCFEAEVMVSRVQQHMKTCTHAR